jgi:CO/xanthine dehydrogenase FAD-binding subunit
VGRRRGDFALVGAAVQVTLDYERIVDARVCFTGVDQIPHRWLPNKGGALWGLVTS